MSLQHSYPLPPSELLAIMLDLDYLKARHERFKGVGTPDVERAGTDAMITTIRQLPLDKIPAAFRSFVGDGKITQIDTWHLPESTVPDEGPILGDWRAELPSAPARMGGQHRVEPSETGSDYTVDVDISVKIPLFGGKVESQVRGYMEHLITKEQAFLGDWISSR